MTTHSKQLLVEVERLLALVGPAELEAALNEVEARNSERLRRMRELVRTLSENSAGRPSKKEKKAKATPKEVLDRKVESLRKSRSQRDQAVADFVAEISDRRILPAAGDLRTFVRGAGVALTSAKTDRSVLAKRLADHLLNIEASRTMEIIETGRRSASDESSLQRWANVIVKN
ncbi:hypothetical protein [Brevundimonas sp.]|jgi:hypothetical protein|uniref:hypothetical protein n=1 Tax=Brevundimonas sp. TaxID=1871086 RepID=UPI003D0D6017